VRDQRLQSIQHQINDLEEYLLRSCQRRLHVVEHDLGDGVEVGEQPGWHRAGRHEGEHILADLL